MKAGEVFTMPSVNTVNPKTRSFAHQITGTDKLVAHDAFALFDEMGCGKSKQVIDAACALAETGKIDTVVVVAPASVKCVWLNSEIGEIKKHSWISGSIFEFHSKLRLKWQQTFGPPNIEHPSLTWIVTNYEFLRGALHLEQLIELLGRKTMLVLDESSYIKNRTAHQTRAVKKLREKCARCVLLNGTPVVNSPLDLWSQMEILSPEILKKDFGNYYHFRSEYCEMITRRFGAKKFNEVVRYKRLDDLAKRLAPYVLRREKKDCLDLPAKLYTQREVALTKQSWERYKELKNDCLVTLSDKAVQIEPNAAVRIMRLAQLTSGMLGSNDWQGTDPRSNEFPVTTGQEQIYQNSRAQIQDLSDEKLRWAVAYLTEETTTRAVIVWCRWRRERERLFEMLMKFSEHTKSQLQAGLDKLAVWQLYGGQAKDEREEAVRRFSEPSSNAKRYVLIAQQHAGGFGLNLVAASEAIYLSNDFALGVRLQSEDRCHRPGQLHSVLYTDVLATGPKGERTVDHVIARALRAKKSLAMMTCAEWRRELE